VVATQEGRNPPLQTLHVVEAFDVRWGQREGSVGAHPAPESPKPWSQITSAGEEEDIVTDALLSLREVVRTALEWQRLGRKRAKEGVNRATAVHINQILRHIGSRMAKSGLRPHLVGVGAGVVLCHLMHLVLRRPGPGELEGVVCVPLLHAASRRAVGKGRCVASTGKQFVSISLSHAAQPKKMGRRLAVRSNRTEAGALIIELEELYFDALAAKDLLEAELHRCVQLG
jgi:hypothetical protein